MALSGSGEVPEALQELALVNPESDVYLDAVTQRAFLYQKNEQPFNAIELLQQELDSGRREPILYYYLSSAYSSLDQWPQAEEALRNGLQEHPEDLNLRYQLGMVLEKMERREEARQVMRQILATDPDYADALNYLAYVKAELGEDLEQALLEAKRALEIKPAGYIMDTLGWVYFKLGRYEESRQYLEQAFQAHPDDPVVVEHLADAYRALELWSQAAEFYRQALELDPFAEGVREKLEALPEGHSQ
jgi:tetratricopeptide (TPR) repeat protein